MAAFKTPQRRIVIQSRQYHFVAYDAMPGNPKRDEDPIPAMWYLMVAGRRCPVMPYLEEQAEVDVERHLTKWVRANALGPAEPAKTPAVAEESLWEE